MKVYGGMAIKLKHKRRSELSILRYGLFITWQLQVPTWWEAGQVIGTSGLFDEKLNSNLPEQQQLHRIRYWTCTPDLIA